MSLGTVLSNRPDFHRLCVEAFTGTDWHVVVSAGDRADLGDLVVPPNVEFGRSFPQRQVLRHAAVFVSHAGMNSLMEALAERVPVVALPLTPEQALNAARLAEVGAGRVADIATLTAGHLRELVERTAADPGVAQVLDQRFGPRTSTGGARLAADVVEAAVRAG
ncbi:nucleotide disphospho-sugar-binding domain-containing protein [Actinoplanes sp. NPDC051494]|uniref:nucleotide disphospho-sugar-binding domain-containing protein n=1 Tax=Actinoplanes sp. NPDC051494 TaxID=3363907 RepID=UPI0037B5F130